MIGWLRKHIFTIFDLVKYVGIMALILMFISFNAKVASQTKTTQEIVKSQNQILEAIKQLALDNKITSDQKANLIICMLQVPVEQRTLNTLENCRRQVETGTTKLPATSPATSPTPSQPAVIPAKRNAVPPSNLQKVTKPIIDGINSLLRKVKHENLPSS